MLAAWSLKRVLSVAVSISPFYKIHAVFFNHVLHGLIRSNICCAAQL